LLWHRLYLIEVLDRIAATLRAKGADALAAQEIKRAAIKRVFGFEILPAPFVVAHLQIGLLLQSVGAPLSDRKKERAANLSDQRAYRMGTTGWIEAANVARISRAFAGARCGRAREASNTDSGYFRQSPLQRIRRRRGL
jgi:hypothetical protein